MIATELLEPIKLLDHGYIQYDEHWGSDEQVVRAARMSTKKGFLGWDPGPCNDCMSKGKVVQDVRICIQPPTFQYGVHAHQRLIMDAGEWITEQRELDCLTCNGRGVLAGDQKLLRYLWTGKHATPFEMAGITAAVQAPIMVFREWHRHRTQSYNEMSARYVPLPNLNYVPTVERAMAIVTGNRQAGTAVGADELTVEKATQWLALLIKGYEMDEAIYQYGLQLGIPKELARLKVSVGRYSRMMASTDLRNWLAFLTLRNDKRAQYEIRVYAEKVDYYVSRLFPRTHELFVEAREKK